MKGKGRAFELQEMRRSKREKAGKFFARCCKTILGIFAKKGYSLFPVRVFPFQKRDISFCSPSAILGLWYKVQLCTIVYFFLPQIKVLFIIFANCASVYSKAAKHSPSFNVRQVDNDPPFACFHTKVVVAKQAILQPSFTNCTRATNFSLSEL